MTIKELYIIRARTKRKEMYLMKVTLEWLEKIADHDGLPAKVALELHKRWGWLFFRENLQELQKKQTFELYLHEMSCPLGTIDAFPVPAEDYDRFQCWGEKEFLLRRFFEKYYGRKPKEKIREVYEVDNPYRGKDYVWYYRRRS
jgi:hypothetical protein